MFKEITGMKSFTVNTDAIALKSSYFKKKQNLKDMY